MKTSTILSATPVAVALLIAGTIYNVHNVHAFVATTANISATTGIAASNTSSNAMVNADVNVGANASSGVMTTNAVQAVTTSGGINVGTNADLTTYAQSMSANNSSVSSVDTNSNDSVTVHYKRPAKLFGFISVNLTETATVKANSSGSPSVSVHKSWWSAFASSNAKTDQFSSALNARVQSDSSAYANGSATLTASQKAQYLADINTAAQAAYSGSASANSSASVNAY